MKGAWPLVGRDDELELIRERLAAPKPSSLVVAGEAGVGKSRLAQEALHLAEALGWRTARAGATKAAASIPFGALAPILPDEDSPSETRAALLRRAAAAVTQLGAGNRLLLWIDDAHDLDGASATLVHQLGIEAKISLVLTVRSGEPAPDPITALWKDGIADRIELQPLSRAETDELVCAALGGDADNAMLERLWAASLGNPLYLRELYTGADDARIFTNEAGLWRLGGHLHAPQRLAELLEGRLSSLPEDAIRAAELLAMWSELGLAQLESMTGPKPIERLEAAGLVRVDTDEKRRPVRLVHPLYEEVLRSRIPAVRKRAIQREMADAIERTGARRRGDVLRIVVLRLDAEGPVPADLLERAARDAYFTYDFSLAERVARSALDAGAGWGTKRLLAEILRYAARYEETEQVLADLDTAALPDDEARALVAMGRSENLFRGLLRPDDARLVLSDALDQVTDDMWRGEMIALAASYDLMEGRVAKALDAVMPILDGPVDRALAASSIIAALGLSVTGRCLDAIDVAQRGLDAALALGPQPLVGDPATHVVMRCFALVHAGRIDDVETQAGSIYEWVVGQGIAVGQAWLGLILGHAALSSGHAGRAEHLFREAAIASAEINDPSLERWSWCGAAHACALRRDLVGARESLRRVETTQPSTMILANLEIERARAWTAAAAGEHSRARELLLAAAEYGRSTGQHAEEAWALHDLARLGDPDAAVTRMTELTSIVQGPGQELQAEHVAALAARDGARLDAVSVALEELGHVLVAAEAAAAAARAHRHAGRQRPAAASAVRAKDLAARCEGALTPALEDAAEVVPLTLREHEIASLVAQGLTSKAIAERLVVSVRTVENHLQRVYEKLGVGSRAELARRLAQSE